MLPLFQVISDLEKANHSNTSCQTNYSSFVENVSSVVTENDEASSPKYAEPQNDYMDRSENSEVSCISDVPISDKILTDNKRRHKKRRRLKTDMSSEVSNPIVQHSKKRKPKTIQRRRSLSDDIQQYTEDEKSFVKEKGKKTIGMFTAMALNMYKDDEIDMSRHFKDLSRGDFEFHSEKGADTEFPIYEDPIQVVGLDKNGDKKTKRRSHHSDDEATKDLSKKMSKKNIIKNYESMLSVLLGKFQRNESIIKEKDQQMLKMKRRLRQVLEFNNRFADENEYFKKQHADMKACIEQYKNYISSLEVQQQGTNDQRRLSDSVVGNQTCPRCSIMEANVIKFEKENIKLNEDVIMLKNVVFRLNVQLSRYQEKLHNIQSFRTVPDRIESTINKKPSDAVENKENERVSIPSLPIFPMIHTIESSDKGDESLNAAENLQDDKNIPAESQTAKPSANEDTYSITYERCTTWGDVNTHTLAPLLNAYQESLMEKDELIRDYEREFNKFTSKLKQILIENDNLHETLTEIAAELSSIKETCGLAVKERDDLRKDNAVMKEALNESESKLKEVHECYEQKVESMSRDYTLIHQEYFRTKTGLAAAQGKCQALESQQKVNQMESMMPVKIHLMRIDECKKLFDELKVRYDLEKSKLSTRSNVLQENMTLLEKKYLDSCNQKQNIETRLKKKEILVRKYRRALVSFRQELHATRTSRDIFKRRANRATELCKKMAIILDQTAGDERIQHLKNETMTVQKEALRELNAVEERMKKQNRNLIRIQEENLREISRLNDVLRERDAKIEAMKQYVSGERLKRYAEKTPKMGTLPINVNKMRSELLPLRSGSLPTKNYNPGVYSSSFLINKNS